MDKAEIRKAAKEAGLDIRESSPEEEAAFDEWLRDPDNKARWDKAIIEARSHLSPEEEK